MLDPATRIALLVGRGGTKTTTMRVRAVLKVTGLVNADVRFLANSRQHAEELMWDPLKRMCDAYGISDDMKFLDSKLQMRCRRTGSVYKLFGVEDKKDADKLRGFPPDEVQLDEVGAMDPKLLQYAIKECIAPRIGERRGSIVIGSTPPARLSGPFYDATRHGAVDEKGVPLHRAYKDRAKPEFLKWIRWSSHAWDAEQIVALPNAAEKYPAVVANWEEALVTKEREGWSDDNPIWQREYKGRWASDHTDRVFRYRAHVDGKPWNQWDPFKGADLEGISALKCAVDALPKDVGTWHFVLAMDSGSKDPFAMNVLAFAPGDPLRRKIHVFCFERTGMYARTVAETLIGPESVARCLAGQPPEPFGGMFGVTGWPDATVIDADQVFIDELANVYGIRAKKAEKKADYKYGAIELVNGDFIDGRILILKGSHLETQLEELQWKPDDYGILREDKAQANHSTDTLIYGRLEITNMFDSGVVTQEGATKDRAAAILEEISQSRRDEYEGLLTDPGFADSEGGW